MSIYDHWLTNEAYLSAITVTNISTRWRQRSTGIDMEQSYVTVTLCISGSITVVPCGLLRFQADPIQTKYDTIRDAILTCARKPTWVSLIYRTEPTTKNCKTEKLKSKNRHARSNSKSMGNHVVSPEEEKTGCSGKDLQKRKVLSLEWKREWVMKN